jgi:hypothetical protein
MAAAGVVACIRSLWLVAPVICKGLGVNRTQKILVAAGVLLIASIAGALLLRNQYGAIAKNDMLGVVPGMTRDQIEKLITARRWVCVAAAAGESIDCNTTAGPLTVSFAPGDDRTPVRSARVRLANPEKLSFDATAQDISAQYGRKPDQVSPTQIGWTLAGGMPLILTQEPGKELSLSLSDNPAAPAPAR